MLLSWLASLLACSGAPAPQEQPAASQAPIQAPVFDAWPQEPDLLPAPSEIAQLLKDRQLQTACLPHAQSVSYKTEVSVARIAAARVGAELGALVVEAPSQSPELLALRAERIHAGLAKMDPDSAATQQALALQLFLAKSPSGQETVRFLDTQHKLLLNTIESQSESETLPVMLAGAWLQAYHLIAQAMIESGDPSGAHAIFHRPAVGIYFSGYVAEAGSSAIPSGMLGPLQDSLDQLRISTSQDPMSMEDLRAIEHSLGDILGML